jgi:FkbM family methyltransferase
MASSTALWNTATVETLARVWRYVRRPDVRRDPLRLISRRAVYGFQRRIVPGRLTEVRRFEIHDGLVVNGRLSDVISRSLYLYGTFEYASMEAFKMLTRPGDIVVDAGAHIGTYTLSASRLVGPAGRVLAFEPDLANLELLRRNVTGNHASNVAIHGVALFDRSTMLPLEGTPYEANSGLPRLSRNVVGHERWPMVRCRPLDELLTECDIDSIQVMKVDVEGFEAEVFAGAQRILQACRPDILFEVGDLQESERGATSPAIDLLRSLDYEIFGIRMHKGRPQLDPIPATAPASLYTDVYRERWQQLNLVARHAGSAR